MFGESFPTPWSVEVLPYIEGATDAHNNPIDSWQDPGISRPVFGWASPSDDTEPTTPGTPLAVQRDLDVYVPPEFVATAHDRVRVDGLLYSVVGYLADFVHSPFGFNPGRRLSLRRVTGE